VGDGEDAMNGGRASVGVVPGRRDVDGVVVVAGGREPAVAAPAVGGDRGALGDARGDEALQVCARRRGNGSQPQQAERAFWSRPLRP
jgi:hypothetical protein